MQPSYKKSIVQGMFPFDPRRLSNCKDDRIRTELCEVLDNCGLVTVRISESDSALVLSDPEGFLSGIRAGV